jgi:hypothetical protein
MMLGDPLAAWISAAVFAKLCGATDPVAVVEEASRGQASEAERKVYLAHLRLIQELSEAQRDS